MSDEQQQQQIAVDDEKVFWETFKLFDTDKKGCICKEDLHKGLCALGSNPTKEEINNMMEIADTDGNGNVDFQEFCVMMKKFKCNKSAEENEEQYRVAFNLFDKDGNGFISPEELKLTLMNVGEQMTEEECRDMMKEFDLNGDGFIDYYEFKTMMDFNPIA